MAVLHSKWKLLTPRDAALFEKHNFTFGCGCQLYFEYHFEVESIVQSELLGSVRRSSLEEFLASRDEKEGFWDCLSRPFVLGEKIVRVTSVQRVLDNIFKPSG